MQNEFQTQQVDSLHNSVIDSRANKQAGFTIIEVGVGIVIFLIVMGAIYGLLEVARSGRLNATQRTEVMQNVRIALNTMGRDAINSGVDYPNHGSTLRDDKISTLLGGPADIDDERDILTPVQALDNVKSVNGTLTDQVTFVYIDDTFNSGNSLVIDQVSNKDTRLRISTASGTNAGCNVGDVYVVSGQNGSTLAYLTSKSGTQFLLFEDDSAKDPLDINDPPNDPETLTFKGIQLPASLTRVVWVSYYVNDEDGNGTGTGTLVRRLFGGSTGWVDQPISFGVQNMQIQYVLASSNTVDSPLTDEMSAIRQVRFNVTVRSPDIDPRTNQPFVSTLTSTYSTRNLAYEKF